LWRSRLCQKKYDVKIENCDRNKNNDWQEYLWGNLSYKNFKTI